MKRALVPLLVALLARAAAADAPPPQPALPAEPRPLMLAPTGDATRAPAPDPQARAALADDLGALQRAVERVKSALAAAGPRAGGDDAHDAATAPAAAKDGLPPPHEPEGEPRASKLFSISAQRWRDGVVTIAADVRQERLERVYRELAVAIGKPIDDSRLAGTHGLATLRVVDLPWDAALDRLLGQAGLAWREEGAGAAAKLVVIDPALERPTPDRLERQAQQALEAAARAEGAIGVEARYRLGESEARAGHALDAIRAWHAIVADHVSAKDARLRAWALKAERGIADEMAVIGRRLDARVVYQDWLARAPEDEPALATVYLACAEQSLALAKSGDEAAGDDLAADTLHAMLERCGDNPRFAAETARARLKLGELLLRAGRHREASIQLARFAEAAGRVDDQVAFWRAECDYALGDPAAARPAYERLLARWHRKEADPTAGEEAYATSAFRIGQCWLEAKPANHVRALFAFLRAQQEFPRSPLEPEILVNVARCYAEIEREDDEIASLMQLLQTDAVVDPRPGRLQIDQLLGDLEGRMAAYPGPVRARILFHIAQANYGQALRERGDRERLLADAVQRYERVLAEDPPAELASAARIGLARASFLAGDEPRGLDVIRAVLADRSLGARDRDLAAQVLGNHLRAKGRLRDAITAYEGHTP